MPVQPRRLRVVFRRAPDPEPERVRHEVIDLVAQGLASRALTEARAEAEARLGRPLQHEPEPSVEPSPVKRMMRRALEGA